MPIYNQPLTSAQHLPNHSTCFYKEFVSAFHVSTLSTNEKSWHRAAAGRKWKNTFRKSVRAVVFNLTCVSIYNLSMPTSRTIWPQHVAICNCETANRYKWQSLLDCGLSKSSHFFSCVTPSRVNISLTWGGAVAVHLQLNGNLSELRQFRSKIADLQICKNGLGSASQLVCGYIL